MLLSNEARIYFFSSVLRGESIYVQIKLVILVKLPQGIVNTQKSTSMRGKASVKLTKVTLEMI
jgi:hypothetical protein